MILRPRKKTGAQIHTTPIHTKTSHTNDKTLSNHTLQLTPSNTTQHTLHTPPHPSIETHSQHLSNPTHQQNTTITNPLQTVETSPLEDTTLQTLHTPQIKSNEWTAHSASLHLKENWANPVSPVSFLGITRIFHFYNKKLKITRIKDILETIDSWSLMKLNRSPKKSLNKFTTYHIHDLWMVDTIDVSELKDHNYGIQHLFSAIDCFSRKAFVIPLINHTAEDGIFAFNQIFNAIGELPQNIGSDKGSECGSQKVKNFLRSNGINPVILSGPSKAANIESFQKTLQRMIYTFITEYDNLSYIPFLQHIVNSYNERTHSSTGFTPNQVEESPVIQNKLEDRNFSIKMEDLKNKKTPSLKRGDLVRISLKKSKFHRIYNIQNTYERFKIYKINTKFKNPRYFLQEEDNTVLEGSFSRSELTKVNLNTFKASTIKQKYVKGKKYVLLDFKGYAPKYRSWTLENNTQALLKNHPTTHHNKTKL